MIIMDNENYIQTNRLEAFYDAIIAIIVTVLVLELPQPETASIAAIWAIKNSYFAYLISFLICVNVWQYHHWIYNHVERINKKSSGRTLYCCWLSHWFHTWPHLLQTIHFHCLHRYYMVLIFFWWIYCFISCQNHWLKSIQKISHW